MIILFISTFGILGILSRFWLVRFNLPEFPWGTFSANLVGCYAIGTIYFFGEIQNHIGPGIKVAVVVGLLGGLTTFSSFMIECVQYLMKQEYYFFLRYFLSSNFFGLVATWIAIWLPTRFGR